MRYGPEGGSYMNIHDFSRITFICINAPLETIENAIKEFILCDSNGKKFSFKKSKYSLLDAFDVNDIQQPQRISNKSYYKALFYLPLSHRNYTIMVSNLNDGWFTLCNVLCKHMNRDYYLFTIEDDSNPEPKNSFAYFSKGKIERNVYTLKEANKWVFYENGAIQSFEEPSNYRKRQIKERLNKTILVKYCHNLNLNIEDDRFWESEGAGLLVKYEW
jgi:hypothetical protein